MEVRHSIIHPFATALAVALSLVLIVPAKAAIVRAASASRSDVASAINSASDGDTVTIPPGTASWTSTLEISKGITLQGAGPDATTLQDDVSRSASGTKPLIHLLTAAGKSYRITGFRVAAGSSLTQQSDKTFTGTVAVFGNSQAVRLDHLKFNDSFNVGIKFYGWIYGVVDHCYFDSGFTQGVVLWHDTWDNKSWGDGSWAKPVNWGSQEFIFLEDNTFVGATTAGAMDAEGGGRFVFRYNTCIDTFTGIHGTESGQRYRSARAYEFYSNTFKCTNTIFTAILLRGGTGVIYNNTFDNFGSSVKAANYRSNQVYVPWGMANGSSPYDGNTDQYGYPCIDQCGRSTGDLLTGNETPLPAAWPHQVAEPIYFWNNTATNTQWPLMYSQHENVIKEGRDFFNNIPKPNYRAFVYPHPLVTGDPINRPAPPKNLSTTPKP